QGALGSPERPSVHPGHHQIEEDDVGGPSTEERESLSPVGGAADVVALVAQRVLQDERDLLVVLDDQDAERIIHPRPPSESTARPAARASAWCPVPRRGS